MDHNEKKNAAKRRHPALVIILDVLLAGVILVTFSFFHHVLPYLQAHAPSAVPTATMPPQTAAPTLSPTLPPTPPPTPEVPEESAEPDTRTPWQKQFEGVFSDGVIRTENSYSSPNVSISLETVTLGEGRDQIVCHVADIYVASLENFCTYTANNSLQYYASQDAMEMDEASGALIAISGDFFSYQQGGFLIRNGETYSAKRTSYDICVMFYDGSMEMYMGGNYDVDELLERGVYQAWTFGPSLLDETGQPYSSYKVSTAVGFPNPRSAIGYYAPGHYCFVVVDGRQDGYSKGMTIPELAQLFSDLGCTSAYNLDGGGSALMTFDHARYSRQSNGANRQLGDIILIREVEP